MLLLKKIFSALTGYKKGHIYAIKNRDEKYLYVGYTQNISQRMQDHKKVKKRGSYRYKNLNVERGDTFTVLKTLYWTNPRKLQREELAAIKKYKPKRNKRSYSK